jgi:TrmH family RNA methyltransferase
MLLVVHPVLLVCTRIALLYTWIMVEIRSLQNPRVKHVVKLREDRRQRQRDGLILVEGQYELELALASGLCPIETFHCEEFGTKNPEAFSDLRHTTVTRSVFEKMSQRENPDGWLAILPTPHRTFESIHPVSAPFIALAESIEKPGNLGAMLRSADAAGVDGFLVCDPRVELYNPNVVRASRGTLFTVPAVETTNGESLAWLRANGILILAATPKAKKKYTDVDLRQPICIAVGTEDEGLTDFWLDNADLTVQIPMAGKVNSLNVSTSTAIIFYEVVRQRSRITASP